MSLAPNIYHGRNIDHLLKASGYVYNNGYRTVKEFIAIFGFDPQFESEFFKITAHGFVFANKRFNDLCNTHFAMVKTNYNALKN